MMDYPLGWPLVQDMPVVRERLVQHGRGTVLVAVDDLVEPGDAIVQPGEGKPLQAGLRGRITRVFPERGVVIEGVATVLNGIVGFGLPVAGRIHPVPAKSINALTVLPEESIVVTTGVISDELIFACTANHVAALVAASASVRTLETIIQCDSTALVDGTLPAARELPFTIVLMHGFGNFQLKKMLWDELSSHANEIAFLSPLTDIQRGLRPELVIPAAMQAKPHVGGSDPILLPGAHVWITAGEHDGTAGVITRMLERKFHFPSGSFLLAARVRLESGEDATVPLSNMQRVG